MKLTVNQLFEKLTAVHTGLASATPVTKETGEEKRKRIARLEANQEEWIAYYFPKYARSKPAKFHLAAAKRVLHNPEWYEVRSWSRELAKSTRTMMEIFYLVFVGNPIAGPNGKQVRRRKRNVLIISNSYDNACRLLLPYMVNMEKNNRLINDYGDQQQIGNWSAGEFICKIGAAFRALGAGQSPRGTRNEDIRPDLIVFDDLDTDEDCRNSDTIDKHWEWVEQAVIPTRAIDLPLTVLWCGNIIAEDCCVVRAQKFADHTDIINIRDENGHSTWPEKNSEADIERVLSKISYASQQKEYFNNPMSTGKTFTTINWGKCPPLKKLSFVVVYADPATSNKDRPGQTSNLTNSRKAVFIMGKLANKYYIYSGFLDVMSQANFIRSMYECRNYIKQNGDIPAYYVIECNGLQKPFHDQIIVPQNYEYGLTHGGVLPIQEDAREKGDKWFRIEANLEPIARDGNLIFNIDEQQNPHMDRLATQFLAAKPTSKQLDGPDCIEGGKFIIDTRVIPTKDIHLVKRPPNKKRM